jgi:hypothetical protein
MYPPDGRCSKTLATPLREELFKLRLVITHAEAISLARKFISCMVTLVQLKYC